MRAIAHVLIVLLFTGSIVPERNLGELAKVPSLVGHFLDHWSEGQGILDFLAAHYGRHTHDQEHHGARDHQDLPFHGHQHSEQCCPSTIAEPVQPSSSLVERALSIRHLGVPDDPLLPNDLGVSIWRPPRA